MLMLLGHAGAAVDKVSLRQFSVDTCSLGSVVFTDDTLRELKCVQDTGAHGHLQDMQNSCGMQRFDICRGSPAGARHAEILTCRAR